MLTKVERAIKEKNIFILIDSYDNKKDHNLAKLERNQ